jgi:citrate lyase subunit beta / citryl-CoA lyase
MTPAFRSLLFVPGDSERKIAKSSTSEADAIILDLEDSVSPERKQAARQICADVLRGARAKPLFVRINSFRSGLAEADVAAILPVRPDGLMQPKTQSGNDVSKLLSLTGPSMPIIAIATETASSLLNMGSYAAVGGSLVGMAWGGEDLSTELGASSNRTDEGHYSDPYRLTRALCLIGARAAGCEPIDAVYTNYRDLAGLAAEARESARDGFTGKLAIHPEQIPVINTAFTPSQDEQRRAQEIVAAFEASGGAGVIGLDGEMLDMPHLARAHGVLARAQRVRSGHGER